MAIPGDSKGQSGFSRWLKSGSFLERWVKESLVTLPFAVPLVYVFLLFKGRALEFSYLNYAIGTIAVTVIVGFNSAKSSMKRFPEEASRDLVDRSVAPIEPK